MDLVRRVDDGWDFLLDVNPNDFSLEGALIFNLRDEFFKFFLLGCGFQKFRLLFVYVPLDAAMEAVNIVWDVSAQHFKEAQVPRNRDERHTVCIVLVFPQTIGRLQIHAEALLNFLEGFVEGIRDIRFIDGGKLLRQALDVIIIGLQIVVALQHQHVRSLIKVSMKQFSGLLNILDVAPQNAL